jgi:hypothetical protein
MLKNRFREFNFRARNEFFDYFVVMWLENEDILRPDIKKVLGCLQKEAENCNHLFMRMILNL